MRHLLNRRAFAFLPSFVGLAVLLSCEVGTTGTGAALRPADAAPIGMDATPPNDAAETDGTSDASLAIDAPDEASGRDAANASDAGACTLFNCAGACCGNVCMDKSCAGCKVGPFFCPNSATVPDSNGRCVSACSSCQIDGTIAPVACFSCSATTSTSAGFCAHTPDACAATQTAGACPCTNPSASQCPGETQVCDMSGGGAAGACVTCGQTGTQGMHCQGGKSCDQTKGICGN